MNIAPERSSKPAYATCPWCHRTSPESRRDNMGPAPAPNSERTGTAPRDMPGIPTRREPYCIAGAACHDTHSRPWAPGPYKCTDLSCMRAHHPTVPSPCCSWPSSRGDSRHTAAWAGRLCSCTARSNMDVDCYTVPSPGYTRHACSRGSRSPALALYRNTSGSCRRRPSDNRHRMCAYHVNRIRSWCRRHTCLPASRMRSTRSSVPCLDCSCGSGFRNRRCTPASAHRRSVGLRNGCSSGNRRRSARGPCSDSHAS
jgi:hypothetical protein